MVSQIEDRKHDSAEALSPESQNVGVQKEEEIAASSQPPAVTIPDGGLVAWLNVCGSVVICFCTFGFVQVFGVYQDLYTRHILSESSPSKISWIGSTQVFLMFILSIFSGKLFDDGYFRSLLLAASILLVFCTFMLSLTQPHHYVQVFLSQGVGQGIAMGLMFNPCVAVLPQYFAVHRALVLGIALAGASVGGVILPIMLNNLFNGHAGFAWGVRYLGFLTLGLLIFANIVMKRRFPARQSIKQQNSQLLKKLLTDIPYLIFIAGLFLVYWGLYFPFFYVQLFAVLHGIDENLAFYCIPILNAGSLLGRTIPNFLADYYGSVNIIPFSGFISTVLIFALLGIKTAPGLIVFSVLYGFTSGAFLSLSLSGVVKFADDLTEVGIRTGFSLFFLSFALLTGNPIEGALLRPPQYEWHRPIIFCGVVMGVGCALLLVSRTLLAKKLGTWKV